MIHAHNGSEHACNGPAENARILRTFSENMAFIVIIGKPQRNMRSTPAFARYHRLHQIRQPGCSVGHAGGLCRLRFRLLSFGIVQRRPQLFCETIWREIVLPDNGGSACSAQLRRVGGLVLIERKWEWH